MSLAVMCKMQKHTLRFARGWNLNGRLIASCIRNIRTKIVKNLIILLQVTINNVADPFLGHRVDIHDVLVTELTAECE